MPAIGNLGSSCRKRVDFLGGVLMGDLEEASLWGD